MTEAVLLNLVESVENAPVSVATGGVRVDDANPRYGPACQQLDVELRRRGIENPIPYSDALALALQHRRPADFRQADMCVEGTAAVVNVTAMASGRRDPAGEVPRSYR